MKRAAVLGLFLVPVLLSGCALDTLLRDLINEAPRAVIDAAPKEGAAPLTVSFDARYSHDDGTLVEYRWDFGDPATPRSEAGSATQHTYENTGTYLAKLTVIDNEGLTDSQYFAVVVNNSAPVPTVSASNENPLPGYEVTFDASESYDYNGTIVSFTWDFGDGAAATGTTVRHSYIQGGYYVVTLTVSDDEGASASTHFGMNVQAGSSNCDDSSGDTCGGGGVPLAVITGLPSCSGGRVGDSITLDGRSSRPATGRIVRYDWDFGDGTTGTGPTVTHVYTKAWTYLVVLTVTDEGGGVATAQGHCSIEGSTCY